MLKNLSFTPAEVVVYAECIRLTPDELLASQDFYSYFINVW